MLYFRKNGEEVEKYNVVFDEEKVKELKHEIVLKCSLITHQEHVSDYEPRFYDDEYIMNYEYERVGEKEYFEEVRDVYRYSYDEYKPPRLVTLINLLLNQNVKAVDEILNYDLSNDFSIDEKIEEANKQFMEIDIADIKRKKEKLEELERLLRQQELNANQEDVDAYYNKLLELIKFDLIDSIDFNQLNRVETFFETELANKEIGSTNNSFVKTLRK